MVYKYIHFILLIKLEARKLQRINSKKLNPVYNNVKAQLIKILKSIWEYKNWGKCLFLIKEVKMSNVELYFQTIINEVFSLERNQTF